MVFAVLQCAMMFCFGFSAGNFSAMAMETMGHLAGIAASLQGFTIMVGASVIALIVGQQVSHSAAPIAFGYFVCALLSLAAVLYAEGGRLFRPQHLPATAPPRAPLAAHRQA